MTKNNQSLLGKKIIITSEDLGFLNTLEKLFIFAGAESIITKTCDELISCTKSKNPDLAIIDINEKSKVEDIIKELKNLTSDTIPVILIVDKVPDEIVDFKIDYVIPKKSLQLPDLIRASEEILANTKSKKTNETIDITEKRPLPTIDAQNNKDIRVLIVEDDPLLRNLLSIRFSKSKIPHLFCHNGLDVITKLTDYKPTVIILDIMLPGKNGLDVLKEIREIDNYLNTPVIVFSNKDSDSDRKLARALNADDFLIKAMTDLNELIEIVLKKQKTR